MEKKRKFHLTSLQVILLGFLGVIFVGALLLMIPVATADGEETSFLTALFTSTTSVCVTGLVVVDTFSHWTLFGKIIILLLIQLGGFGVITVYSSAMLMLHRRFSFKLRLLVHDYYNLDSIQGLIRFMKGVIKGTLVVEAVGAVLYCFVFVPEFGLVKGMWVSLFNSISAFCNAGIDIIGPNSLVDYQTNVPINLITMALIILGGLGYVVWFDVIHTAKRVISKKQNPLQIFRRLSEHSKLVLSLTLFLIISGAVLVALFEWDNPTTLGNMTTGEKIMTSTFQSVTFRTAGFATVPQGNLTPSTAIIGLLYMFIGGSPVGTAGGVKTVTVFIIFLNAMSFIRNRDEMVVFRTSVSHQMVSKATAIVTVSLMITITFILMLITLGKAEPLSAAYEVFSATATVGLSRGLTATLNSVGRVIIIIAMYLGRIGPISLALVFAVGDKKMNRVNYAKGHFYIG